ncbi:MAG: hypothetical protein ACOCXQ_05085 [Patescibacteria group bacterium]
MSCSSIVSILGRLILVLFICIGTISCTADEETPDAIIIDESLDITPSGDIIQTTEIPVFVVSTETPPPVFTPVPTTTISPQETATSVPTSGLPGTLPGTGGPTQMP